jgi:hypothetical protein
VSGFHQDAGLPRCEGSVTLTVKGGFFSSPAGPVAFVITALSAAGVVIAARPRTPRRVMRRRGRPVLGTISGLLMGLFLGVTLLSFGALPLNSSALTVLPVVGLVLGLALALWAPLGRRPRSPVPASTPPRPGEGPPPV